MAKRASSDKTLSNTLTRYSRHDSYIHSFFFNSLSDSQSIDHRSEHSHMISCNTVKSSSFKGNSTKNISSSYHNGNFQFLFFYKKNNLLRKKCKKLGINTIALFSLQCLTREFEKDTFWCMVLFHKKVGKVKRQKITRLQETSIEKEHNRESKYKDKKQSKRNNGSIALGNLLFETSYRLGKARYIRHIFFFCTFEKKCRLIVFNKRHHTFHLCFNLAEFIGKILNEVFFLTNQNLSLFIKTNKFCKSLVVDSCLRKSCCLRSL